MEIIILGIVAYVIYKLKIVRGIINIIKKSQATSVMRNMLDKQRGIFDYCGDMDIDTMQFVQNAWDDMPDVFNGVYGKRPHVLATVAYALAISLKKLRSNNDQNRLPVMIALGGLLNHIDERGSFYNFNGTDNALIVKAVEVYLSLAEDEVGEDKDIDALFGSMKGVYQGMGK